MTDCQHDKNVTYVRALARHGDADLIVGSDVVFAASNNGTALVEWCDECGALKVNGSWRAPPPERVAIVKFMRDRAEAILTEGYVVAKEFESEALLQTTARILRKIVLVFADSIERGDHRP